MSNYRDGDCAVEGLAGMTINERLVASGLLDQWDQAVIQRDKLTMASLLHQVAIDADDAESIATAVLADPKKFGCK